MWLTHWIFKWFILHTSCTIYYFCALFMKSIVCNSYVIWAILFCVATRTLIFHTQFEWFILYTIVAHYTYYFHTDKRDVMVWSKPLKLRMKNQLILHSSTYVKWLGRYLLDLYTWIWTCEQILACKAVTLHTSVWSDLFFH